MAKAMILVFLFAHMTKAQGAEATNSTIAKDAHSQEPPVGGDARKAEHHHHHHHAKDGLIYLIRHGEKDSHGCESATGLKRAANLYDVFKTKFSLPSYVFAYKYDGECQRCKQTVDPIAHKLGLSVDFTHGARQGEGKGFANAIKNEASKGKTVLVASEHNHIQYIANDIGVPKNEIPHWHGSDYDSVYVVTLSGDKASLVHKHQTKDVSEVVV